MLQFYEDILQHFEKNPSTSTHVVGHTIGVDRDQSVHWFVLQST